MVFVLAGLGFLDVSPSEDKLPLGPEKVWILGPFWMPSWAPKTAKLAQEASWSEVKAIFGGSWTVLKKHLKKMKISHPTSLQNRASVVRAGGMRR